MIFTVLAPHMHILYFEETHLFYYFSYPFPCSPHIYNFNEFHCAIFIHIYNVLLSYSSHHSLFSSYPTILLLHSCHIIISISNFYYHYYLHGESTYERKQDISLSKLGLFCSTYEIQFHPLSFEPNNTPLCVYITFYLFIHCFLGTYAYSIPWVL
jgi:hypothetical protein